MRDIFTLLSKKPLLTLARYNITIQDIKLANKIWTNEGMWPGRTLRIPVVEVCRSDLSQLRPILRYLQTGSTSLDLSGSETMSTDSQISANLAANSSSSSSNVSRRLSNNDSGLFPDSPVSLPLRLRSPREKSTSEAVPNSSQARRASIEDLSDFLSKMDSSIAVNTKTSISLIKSSKIEEKEGDVPVSRNNTNSRLSEGYSTEEEMSQSFRKNFN